MNDYSHSPDKIIKECFTKEFIRVHDKIGKHEFELDFANIATLESKIHEICRNYRELYDLGIKQDIGNIITTLRTMNYNEIDITYSDYVFIYYGQQIIFKIKNTHKFLDSPNDTDKYGNVLSVDIMEYRNALIEYHNQRRYNNIKQGVRGIFIMFAVTFSVLILASFIDKALFRK